MEIELEKVKISECENDDFCFLGKKETSVRFSSRKKNKLKNEYPIF
jgi:hypothetical protein